MSDLMELKNIGTTSAHWLEAVGIKDKSTLKDIGVTEAYLRIHRRGIKTSKVLLYALHGALYDQHWNEIPDEIKDSLNKAVEKALKNKNEVSLS